MEPDRLIRRDFEAGGRPHQHPRVFAHSAAKKGRQARHDPQARLRLDDHDIHDAVVQACERGDLGAFTVLARVGDRDEDGARAERRPAIFRHGNQYSHGW